MTTISQPLSVDQDPDLEHYLVRNRIEVLSVLRTLAERKIPIRITFSQKPEPMYAKLVSVKPEFEELVFDAAGTPYLESLDAAEGLMAESHYDSIRILFSSGYAEAAIYRGQPVFRARLPKALARIRRRSSVRCPVPALNPPVVSLRLSADDKRELNLRVMDISLAGAALVSEDPNAAFKAGMTLRQCRVHLPGCGAIETDLEVSHLTTLDTVSGWRRMGCRFSGLTVLALEHVRRYVSSLEREHPHTN